jgi:hypothetical protein
VQTAAICGLGNLGDTKDETLVSGNLDANDRGVRLAAAIALQQIATPESANTLNAKLKSETDPEVRDALWRAFRRLFPLLNESELNQWANVFTYDPAKRLDILVALAEKLAKSHNDSSLAATNQDIAEGYMRTNQPAAAIVSLQKAIDYWQQKNTDDGHLYAAITDMLQYQFKAGKYADAVAFGEKQISLNGAYEQPVVGALKQEAESLISGAAPSVEELANARVLATGALKYPNLSEKYRNQLQQILDSILQKQAAATAPHG